MKSQSSSSSPSLSSSLDADLKPSSALFAAAVPSFLSLLLLVILFCSQVSCSYFIVVSRLLSRLVVHSVLSPSTPVSCDSALDENAGNEKMMMRRKLVSYQCPKRREERIQRHQKKE